MLALDDPQWSKLSHAYGNARDIPVLLKQLESNPLVPHEDWQSEPWFSLRSALCHQGDVYTASYATVPPIVRIGASSTSTTPDWRFFGLPASIEIARLSGNGPTIPAHLAKAYGAVWQALQNIIHAIAAKPWDELLSRCTAGTLVVAKGHVLLADTIMELSPEAIHEFRVHQGLEGEDEGSA